MAMTTQDVLQVMPEQYYFDTLQPHMSKMLAGCTYDEELTRSLEKAINIANQHAARKDYDSLGDDFTVLSTVLTRPNYLKGKNSLYINASPEEKKMVADLLQDIQELQTIIKCTPVTEVKAPTERQRIGYNAETKQNLNVENKKPTQTRIRY